MSSDDSHKAVEEKVSCFWREYRERLKNSMEWMKCVLLQGGMTDTCVCTCTITRTCTLCAHTHVVYIHVVAALHGRCNYFSGSTLTHV